jgi:hypothetical protein
MTHDAKQRWGDAGSGRDAQFALGWMQGHKNAARERATEG